MYSITQHVEDFVDTFFYVCNAGSFGFILPADQIIPTAEETWAFHITVIRELVKTL